MLKTIALLIPQIRRLYQDRDRLALALRVQQPMQKLLACTRRVMLILHSMLAPTKGSSRVAYGPKDFAERSSLRRATRKLVIRYY
jgi:hypothetical protein